MKTLLTTKLYIPPVRRELVSRPRLIERMNAGLKHKLALISAPAGFGKTTLVGEWAAGCGRPVAWLSLEEGDNDPARFLSYLIAALQTLPLNEARGTEPVIGERLLSALGSPQPPPAEAILTSLLNEITGNPEEFVLVLDDYHVIDSRPASGSASVDGLLAFLLAHLPPQMHLVIATREDPDLPLARYRARGQLTELRAADLRFTPDEASEFLNRVMGLDLSASDISALENRTEGWVTGLQFAALALQGLAVQAPISRRGGPDVTGFIRSFTGSHRFVLDYLLEEVLHQQPESVQKFLLQTSILDRMCGPLCDQILGDRKKGIGDSVDPIPDPLVPWNSQSVLEYLEKANLFIVPLDNERYWYRYHHLFAELLRQRLRQRIASAFGDVEHRIGEFHIRASQWYEDHGFALEAFRHAAAANDVERAERLIDGKGIPLHLSGGVTPILDWLASLPKAVLDARPSLWWRYAAMLLINGQTIGVGEKLQAAEAALRGVGIDTETGEGTDEKTRGLIGQIAAARATLALTRYDVEGMLSQSRRALEFLPPNSLFLRANANWTLGYAYLLLGDRVAARQAFTESIALSQSARAIFTIILATIGLGNVQEADNQLYQAAETYRQVLELAGDQPQQIIHEAHLGLARILYEWNDLKAAEQHARLALQLARQYERVIDRYVICEVFLARLKLAQGDSSGAAAILAQAAQSARQHNFIHRLPEVAAAKVLTFIQQGNLAAATELAKSYALPLSQARVHLAHGDTSAALAVLEKFRREVEARDLKDERLKAIILQAVVLHQRGDQEEAVRLLVEALALAELGGFVRLFLDEGPPMAQLLHAVSGRGILPNYTGKLLSAFETELHKYENQPALSLDLQLVEPLSPRELEVLRLVAQGLSNQEIGERLFLALSTIKGYNRKIYRKLGVQRRTEAILRGRELGLL